MEHYKSTNASDLFDSGAEEFNLWDHFKGLAVAAVDSCAVDLEIATVRPELAQYEKIFELHSGRTLTWFAIEQGFRTVLQMLGEIEDLLVTEEHGKTYVEKKAAEDVDENVDNVPEDP